jgi:CheY-like chemotaxis protein
MIAVSDTGVGMDAATQKRVFEPFFTTKPKGLGTGLGLSMVYGIVSQSGGHLSLYSEVNRGTAFKIYLPRTDEPEAAAEAAPPNARALRGSETILVVEDEDVVREFVRKVLTRQGYTTYALSDPIRAIEFAEQHSGAIQLLLTDVVLPNMSGRDMAVQVLQRHPEPRVLYMSGYTDDAIVHHGVLEPGMWFLQKPFSAEALAKRVREVLDAPIGAAISAGE